jgi:integrase
MAVTDRWHKSRPGRNETVCAEHGMVPTAAHMSDGRWQARWRDASGVQHKANFARKADAAQHQAAAIADTARGTWIDPRAGKITLAEYAPGVLAASPADAPTRENTASRWRLHIMPALGRQPLGQLAARPSLIQSFVTGLSRDGLGDGTVKLILAALSSVLGVAVTDGLIPRNPCDAVKAPRYVQARVVPWPAGRVEAMRDALPGAYAAMTDCGAGLGMRQGETFGLAVDDVDFLRRTVHVRRQVRIVGGHLVFAPPKGQKERDIPLPDSVSLRLAGHIAEHAPVAVTLPWRVPDGKPHTALLMFTMPDGRALGRSTFNRWWKDAGTAAGLVITRTDGFHALRHHFASVLLAGNVDIRALADYLGHADPGFTLRVYCHLMPDAGERMRGAVDRSLGAQQGTAQDGIAQ